MDNKVAILIDGAFLIKRYSSLYGALPTPEEMARKIVAASLQAVRHVNKTNGKDINHKSIYRIIFYDCIPLAKRIQNPVSKKGLNLEKTEAAIFRNDLHQALRKQRKVALRLGRLDGGKEWVIKPDVTKNLLNNKISIADLTESDVRLEVKQKGVDMMIGTDIAALALKERVDQIILVAGDSDFVPSAKLARREGIDFVLDPMWNHINPDLYEHIDGLTSGWQRPRKTQEQN
ncbi:NYN domain-containing protein [Thiomicrospira sp.]|uniref:NYN domain-containing protein n=1 Tax=Thiomicrospira sp. TaxID=935 RepID=UPI002F94A9CA